MPDPTGLSAGLLSWVVGKGLDMLLNKLYAVLQHIRSFEKEYSALKKQLDSFKVLYEEIDAIVQQQPLNSHCLQAWLDNVKICLEKLADLLTCLQPDKCNCSNFMSIRQIRKDILAKGDELEKLVNDGVVKRLLVQVLADNYEIKKLLDEFVQTTQNYMCSSGEKRAIEDKLTNIRSFSICNKMKSSSFSSSHHDAHELICGREDAIEELQQLLMDPQGPKIVALHGSGGAGKTFIARTLINDPKIQAYFGTSNIFWTTVGGDSKISILRKKVEDFIYNKEKQSEDGSEISALFVLDDIWKQEEMKLVQDKSGQCSTFRFLITTRQLKMIEACYNIHRVPVKVLSKSTSWKLFSYHAFPSCSEVQIPLELKGVAELVAEECRGLPLALKVIGRAMSCKTTYLEWKDALKDLRNQVIIHDDQDESLIRVLRISFDVLEIYEKYIGKIRECFLYFGAFEEDASIHVTSLMNCWVGEGLLPDGKNSQHQTYIVLEVLIGSSLIEKVQGEEDRCKIHDVLRDLTFHISRKDRPHQDIFQARADWQPHQGQVNYDKILRIFWSHIAFSPVQIRAQNLKVLLLDSSTKVSEKFLSTSFSSLCSLQVFSLADTKIKYLPGSLGELKCLVVLNLARSSIKHMSYSLRKLTQLKILDFIDCVNLTTFPKGVFLNLKSLQVLRLVRPFKHQPNVIRDVRQFRGLTELTWFTFASIRKLPLNLENMTELTILHMECPIKDLELLKRLHNLEDLEVLGSQLTRLPDWICELSLLGRLVIHTKNKRAAIFLVWTLFADFAFLRYMVGTD